MMRNPCPLATPHSSPRFAPTISPGMIRAFLLVIQWDLVARSSIITAKIVCGSVVETMAPLAAVSAYSYLRSAYQPPMRSGRMTCIENSEGSSSCIGRPHRANLLNDAARME